MKRKVLAFGGAILTTPEIPRLDSFSVEAPRPISPPRATPPSPDAFGAGFGAGTQQASRVGYAILADERQKAERTAAIESRTKLDQAEVDLLYDPKNGALAKRGKDAFSLTEPTLAAFDSRAAEIEQSLATPAQRETFRLMFGQRRVEIDKQLQHHVYGEMKSYADEANKASLESTLNNVAMHYNDPDRIEQERKYGQAVIMSDTDNKGLPPEVVKMKESSWDSMVHKAVIERMMVDNPVSAREYFDANRDRMLATDATKIEHTLKPLAENQQGLAAANRIFYGASEKTSLAEMLKQVHDEFPTNPGVVKAAEGEIHTLYSAREAAAKKAESDAENAVYSYVAKAKLAGRVPQRSDVPADAWANLAKVAPEKVDRIASEILSNQEHATDRARAEQDRRETKATLDNLTTWGMLKTNPSTLQNTNLDALLSRGKISKSQYQDLTTDQLAIKQGKGDHEATILSNKAAVDSVLSAVKITDKKDPERYMKFYETLNGRMKVFEAENGKKPKQEDVLKLARGLLGEVSQDVNFWPIDKSVHVFEADPTKVRVPANDRAAIVRALQSNRLPVTEDAIRKVYLERQARSGGVQ